MQVRPADRSCFKAKLYGAGSDLRFWGINDFDAWFWSRLCDRFHSELVYTSDAQLSTGPVATLESGKPGEGPWPVRLDYRPERKELAAPGYDLGTRELDSSAS